MAEKRNNDTRHVISFQSVSKFIKALAIIKRYLYSKQGIKRDCIGYTFNCHA
jgi:hypothetical protein